MFLISLALIGLIAVTILTDVNSSTTEQAESIPVYVEKNNYSFQSFNDDAR